MQENAIHNHCRQVFQRRNYFLKGLALFFLFAVTFINTTHAQGFGHCPFGNYTFGHCIITEQLQPQLNTFPTCPSGTFGSGTQCIPIQFSQLFTHTQSINDVVFEYKLETSNMTTQGSSIKINNIITNEGADDIEVQCINFIDLNNNSMHDENEPSPAFSKLFYRLQQANITTKINIPLTLSGVKQIIGICTMPGKSSNPAVSSTTILINPLVKTIISAAKQKKTLYLASFLIAVTLIFAAGIAIKKKRESQQNE